VTWEIPLGVKPRPSVFAGTGLGLLGYTDRRAQDATGVNGSKRQRDLSYSLDLGGAWPVTKWFGVVAGVSGQVVSSNNKFERYIRYSYRLVTGTLGVTLRF
jgi:hypothetical protein